MATDVLKPRLPMNGSDTRKWQIWQRMTRVLGTMAQVGLSQIGESPPPRNDLHATPRRKTTAALRASR